MIDAVIAGLVASIDGPNAAEQARMMIDALDRCGYVIMPKEPTEEMLNAAYGGHLGNDEAEREVYRAFLISRPR